MYDVIIVGAGLAGSSAAAALAHAGKDVLLIEKEAFPRHKVCGEFLSPEAQQSLANLGVLEAVSARQPVPLTGASLASGYSQLLPVNLPGAAWGISRFAMDAALAEAAVSYGCELWQKATVTSVQRNDDTSMMVQGRRHGTLFSVEAWLVIIASGRSGGAKLPPKRVLTRADSWSQCVGVKAHYLNVDMPNRVELCMYPGGYVGINPVEDGRVNVCLLVQTDAFQQNGGSPLAALSHSAESTRLGERLEGAVIDSESVCTVAAVDTQRTPEPIWNGSICIGDTAAMIPPLCGDGMAMALRSAELVVPLTVRFLDGKLSYSELLLTYRQVWQKEFRLRLRVGRRLQTLLGLPLAGTALIAAGKYLPGLVDYLGQATRGSVDDAPHSSN